MNVEEKIQQVRSVQELSQQPLQHQLPSISLGADSAFGA